MSHIKVAFIAAAAALLLAACSTSQTGSTPPPTTTPAATAPATSAPALATVAATAGLSGKWSGQYGGAYQGTFNLTWRQSGSTLSGHIRLSTPPSTLRINGTVKGSVIRFGTVGSTAITYSGRVSGNSMSGSYQVHTANGSSGGPWSASKS
jgi:hypothetical protein